MSESINWYDPYQDKSKIHQHKAFELCAKQLTALPTRLRGWALINHVQGLLNMHGINDVPVSALLRWLAEDKKINPDQIQGFSAGFEKSLLALKNTQVSVAPLIPAAKKGALVADNQQVNWDEFADH